MLSRAMVALNAIFSNLLNFKFDPFFLLGWLKKIMEDFPLQEYEKIIRMV